MKFKTVIYSIFISLAFIACDDDFNSVGSGIQPDGDKMTIRTDTFSFTSSTVSIDSIFIKTANTCLGNFEDLFYGNIKYGYLCNFYTSPDEVFSDTVIDNKIDSVLLRLHYYSFVGDSLTPMEATVWKLKNPIGKDFYSNLNPEDYIDRSVPALAKTTYTAHDMNLPDSIYSLIYSSNQTLTRNVVFKLPNTVGEEIYEEWKKHPETFKHLDKFFDFFRGVYIESTYGLGNILNVVGTELEVYHQTIIKGNISQKVDSIVTRHALFSTAEESTLLNVIDKAKSKEKDLELVSETTHTYLKTPSGVVTQLEIPLQDIVNKIGDNRIFNNVGLTLEAIEQESWEYTLPMPNRLLLIDSASVKQFFEEVHLADGYDTYTATLAASSSYQYNFGNISTLIQNSIKKLKENGQEQNEWPPLKLWVIPISIQTVNSTSIATNNLLTPSGAKLKTGQDNLKLYITTTKVNKD